MKRPALALILGFSALLGGCAVESYDSGSYGYSRPYGYESRTTYAYGSPAYGTTVYGGPVYERPALAARPSGPLPCGLSGDCSRGFYDQRGDWHDGWR
jgi:hypothetical protein